MNRRIVVNSQIQPQTIFKTLSLVTRKIWKYDITYSSHVVISKAVRIWVQNDKHIYKCIFQRDGIIFLLWCSKPFFSKPCRTTKKRRKYVCTCINILTQVVITHVCDSVTDLWRRLCKRTYETRQRTLITDINQYLHC